MFNPIPESSSSFPQPIFTSTVNNLLTTPTRNNISEDTGIYVSGDDGLPRAFVNESPKIPSTPRAKTQVDLVLPDPIAFTQPGKLAYGKMSSRNDARSSLFSGMPHLLFLPILGQRSITWDQVFPLIRRPELLWDVWCPSKSLDQYQLNELWECYDLGEKVFNENDVQTGIKPPLRKVELFFHSSWRKQSLVSLEPDLNRLESSHVHTSSNANLGSVSERFPNG